MRPRLILALAIAALAPTACATPLDPSDAVIVEASATGSFTQDLDGAWLNLRITVQNGSADTVHYTPCTTALFFQQPHGWAKAWGMTCAAAHLGDRVAVPPGAVVSREYPVLLQRWRNSPYAWPGPDDAYRITVSLLEARGAALDHARPSNSFRLDPVDADGHDRVRTVTEASCC